MVPKATTRRRQALLRGMTAVEVLIATVLSSMLVVSILGMLATLNTHCRELRGLCRSEPWQQLFAEQLRRDFANARRMTVDHGRIVLTGYLGTDGPGLEATHRVSSVTYGVIADTSCLVREERRLDLNNALTSRKLLATGVCRMEVTLPESPDTEKEYSGPVPMNCQVELYKDKSTVTMAEVSWCK